MILNKPILAAALAYAVQTVAGQSIYNIGKGNENFSTLIAAIDASAAGPAGPNLVDALSGDGTFTIFAPPNSAFDDLPKELVEKLLKPTWQPQLQDVLLYHALGSEVQSTDLSDGLTAAALNEEDITVNLDPPRINDGSNILVGDGLVDIEADNGVIHGISALLTPTSVTSNIVDIAAGNKAFSTLVAAVKAAGLVEALSGEGPLTVFAPTDDAFADLPDGTVDNLLKPENKDQLTDILKYHVVAANAHSAGLSSGDVETLNGDTVALRVTDGGVTVNGASVVTPDIIASNGIIHVVDAVLLPPSDDADSSESIYKIAKGNENFSTLVAAIDASAAGPAGPNLVDALSGDGTFTVFAPPNSAFDDLPKDLVQKLLKPTWQPQLQDVLLYHALGSEVRSTDLSDGLKAATLNKEEIMVNLDPPRINDGSNILVGDGLVDIEADNGVVHAVSAVMTPTSVTSNIVDIAAGNKAISTLVAAVKAAGLVEALSGEGPMTVFAPTDDAFAALPDGTIDDLLKPENKDRLADVLTYHVVPLNAHSAGLSSGNVETLNGDTVTLKVTDGAVTVNGARVITTDIIASNGIIHVVDAVLLPPSDSAEKSPNDEKEPADGEKPDDGEKADATAPEESSEPDGASGAGMLTFGSTMCILTYILAICNA